MNNKTLAEIAYSILLNLQLEIMVLEAIYKFYGEDIDIEKMATDLINDNYVIDERLNDSKIFIHETHIQMAEFIRTLNYIKQNSNKATNPVETILKKIIKISPTNQVTVARHLKMSDITDTLNNLNSYHKNN